MSNSPCSAVSIPPLAASSTPSEEDTLSKYRAVHLSATLIAMCKRVAVQSSAALTVVYKADRRACACDSGMWCAQAGGAAAMQSFAALTIM